MVAEVIDWAGPGEARLVVVAEAHQRVAVLHGVNLGALGKRDSEHYGTLTLSELERQFVDSEGNRNGRLDVGDLRTWLREHGN